MKKAFNIFVGVLALMNIIYKVIKCISCDADFLGMEVSGPVYLMIWTTIAVMIFYGVYRDSKSLK